MADRRRRPILALASAPGSLSALDRALAQHGIAVRRVPVLSIQRRPAGPLLRRLDRFGRVDTILVTSSEAIPAFVRRAAPAIGAMRPAPEVWAVGAETARQLRALGFRRVRRGRAEGVEATLRAMRRRRPRVVLYPRSNRAGPAVARRLRARGDQVLDLVSYVIRPAPRPTVRALGEFERARGILITSPSSIAALRVLVGRRRFSDLRERTLIFVLGERSARAARQLGCRRVRRVPSASVQEISYYVRRGFQDGAQ